jgi:hypothetical protein
LVVNEDDKSGLLDLVNKKNRDLEKREGKNKSQRGSLSKLKSIEKLLVNDGRFNYTEKTLARDRLEKNNSFSSASASSASSGGGGNVRHHSAPSKRRKPHSLNSVVVSPYFSIPVVQGSSSSASIGGGGADVHAQPGGHPKRSRPSRDVIPSVVAVPAAPVVAARAVVPVVNYPAAPSVPSTALLISPMVGDSPMVDDESADYVFIDSDDEGNNGWGSDDSLLPFSPGS